MTPPIDSAHQNDAFDARTRRIRDRILDGIAEALDELGKPRVRRAAIANEVRAQCAALLCRQALCRRAKRCRSQPCKVPPADLRRSD